MIIISFTKEATGDDFAVEVREVRVRNRSHMPYYQQKQIRITINHDIGHMYLSAACDY